MKNSLHAAIFRNAISFQRGRIVFLCGQARQFPHLRPTMLARAREYARDIRETLRIAKDS